MPKCYQAYKAEYDEHMMMCKDYEKVPAYNALDRTFICPCGFVINEFFDSCGCRPDHLCELCTEGQSVPSNLVNPVPSVPVPPITTAPTSTTPHGYQTLDECKNCVFKAYTNYEPHHQFLHAVNVEPNGWLDVWFSFSDEEQVNVMHLMRKIIDFCENQRNMLVSALHLICQEIPNKPSKKFNRLRKNRVNDHLDGLKHYEKMIYTFCRAVHKAISTW